MNDSTSKPETTLEQTTETRRGSINVGERDFEVLAAAAIEARDNGDLEQAMALDKIARKVNAALTGADPARRIATMATGKTSPVRWRDMPSVLDPAL